MSIGRYISAAHSIADGVSSSFCFCPGMPGSCASRLQQCSPDLVEFVTGHAYEPDVLAAAGGQLSAQAPLAQPALGGVAMDSEAFGCLVEDPLGPGLARHGLAPDWPASGHAVAEHQALDHPDLGSRVPGQVPGRRAGQRRDGAPRSARGGTRADTVVGGRDHLPWVLSGPDCPPLRVGLISIAAESPVPT